jgi:hypothetical protein
MVTILASATSEKQKEKAYVQNSDLLLIKVEIIEL